MKKKDRLRERQKEILKGWNDICILGADRPPLMYPPLNPDGILFIGLNPSFTKKDDEKISPIKHIENALREHQADAWVNLSFFNHHRELSEYLESIGEKSHWAAVDLFLDRETNANALIKAIWENGKLTSNAEKQLKYAKEFVEIANPKLIVVANAKATDLLWERLRESESNPLPGLSSERFHQCGVHMTKIGGKKDTPVFFCSQMSGGAMDNFTRKRLFWHIGRILRPDKSLV
ncbi:MAG: hypothetical protein WCQ57_03790 [Verrucomicrobiota bacterium]